MAKKRLLALSENEKFTIRVALRAQYERSMEFLDFHGAHASHFLVQAAEAWNTYRAFTGETLSYHEERS